jgi:hypothetical protein
MFRSLFQGHLQGSSFALSAYHASAATLRHMSVLVCGRMPSVCICIQCTCLCAVWSCKALPFYKVNIKSFLDYKHLLQENCVEYIHILFLLLLKLVVKQLL